MPEGCTMTLLRNGGRASEHAERDSSYSAFHECAITAIPPVITTRVHVMNSIEDIQIDGFTFRVFHEYDSDAGAPWEREDGHGPVRRVKANFTGHHDKRPGELVLNGDFNRGGLVYVFDDACRNARADGWGSYGWQGAGEGMTRRQFAAEQARADYERLRAWCRDEWHYLGVVVVLLDIEGNETDAQQSTWGIESDSESYLTETAQELAGNVLHDVSAMLYGDDGAIYMSGSRSWRVKE